MNEYFFIFKKWYECRSPREKIFILGLSFAIIYMVFNFILFKPLANQEKAFLIDIKTLTKNGETWNKQIEILDQTASSAVYKQWLNQNQFLQSLQGRYKNLFRSSSERKWQDIIKTILHSQPNITVLQIKNFPEMAYDLTKIPGSEAKVYQQKLLVIINSNYFDTIAYLQRLEKILPAIQWNSMSYQVIQYPAAKVEMEFSLLYEKMD